MPLVGEDTHEDESRHGARQRARKLRNLMDLGRDPLAEQEQARGKAAADVERSRAEAVTLAEVAKHYIANKKTRNGPLKPTTIADINRHLDKAFAAWTDKPVKAITRTMCEARHMELASGGLTGRRPAPIQAAQAFTVLRALINWAINKFRVGDEPLMIENPVKVLKGQMAPPRARTTRVPTNEIGAVWNALRGLATDQKLEPTTRTAADALSFYLLTGARLKEALHLTWDRVHLEDGAGCWHLPAPKNGKPVTFPLPAAARALLAERLARRSDKCAYVFPGKGKKKPLGVPRGPAGRALDEAAGLHITRHDLRRTMTTLAVTVLDIPLWKAELLTNHQRKGNVTLDHYVERSDLRYLAAEADRIGAWVLEQADIAAGRNVVRMQERRRA